MKKFNIRAKALISLASVALVGALALAGCAQMGVAADEPADEGADPAIEVVADEAADEAVETEAAVPEAEAEVSEAAEAEAAPAAAMDPTAPYTSDEACLACHGGSYEANAANTADYGIWNPHDSIHGGYNSCDNCHANGQELTFNWCSNCHTYSAEGSEYYEEPLFL